MSSVSSPREAAGLTGLWVVLIATAFAWAPATYPGYWQALEGFAPLFNAPYAAPVADIAAQPDLWRGSGSATFLLTRPLILLGVAPAVAVRAVFALVFVMGSLGIYFWLRPRFGDRSAGLAGLLYALLPPLLATVYIRGSLADALVVGLWPLVLAGLAVYVQTRSPAAIGAAVISLLWIWRTQAGLAVFVTLLALAYVLWVERDRLALLTTGVTGLAGLLSLLPLWGLRASSPVDFYAHFVYFFQYFAGGWQTAPSIPGWQDGYPFQLGFAALAFALVAVWLLWQKYRANVDLPLLLVRRSLIFSLAAVVVLILLTLAPSAFLWRISGTDRLLTWPWQILLPGLPFLALMGGSLPALNSQLACRGYWAALSALVLMSSYPYLSADFTEYTPPAAPVAVYGARGELVLLEATVYESSAGGYDATLEAVWQPVQPLDFDYNLFFQALRPMANGTDYEVVAQLDQQPLTERPATTWQPGEILTSTYTLSLPSDPASANLRYYFGYYDWREGGGRLLVNGGPDDKAVLFGE
ncbi:MAG: hypothetical protein DWI57_11815 [Chloroflexi bacterium]|nr:MAG: hypothetical protein DWI57_11815 [Chloroflexota bacterium]